jgi:hypothetical protein
MLKFRVLVGFGFSDADARFGAAIPLLDSFGQIARSQATKPGIRQVAKMVPPADRPAFVQSIDDFLGTLQF